MDKSFKVITDYYSSLWCELDFEKFQSLFSEHIVFNFIYNDIPTKIDRKESMSRMKRGHFDNTTNITMKSLGIEQISSDEEFVKYSVIEKVVFERLGNGKNEDGSGSYLYEGEGVLTISRDSYLITGFEYTMSKTKM